MHWNTSRLHGVSHVPCPHGQTRIGRQIHNETFVTYFRTILLSISLVLCLLAFTARMTCIFMTHQILDLELGYNYQRSRVKPSAWIAP